MVLRLEDPRKKKKLKRGVTVAKKKGLYANIHDKKEAY